MTARRGKSGAPEPVVDRGERPDLGRTPDQLAETLEEALTGSNLGSDTRAGSLRGGSASGSDIDPDQAVIDAELSREGQAGEAAADDAGVAGANPVNNTGRNARKQGGEADAATG